MRRRTRHLLHAGMLGLLLVSGCVPATRPAPAPTPAPPPPRPVALPAPPPAQTYKNWMDAPQTPGDWRYAAERAEFGLSGAPPVLTLRCDRAGGAVEISRIGTGGSAMTIRTESEDRLVDAAAAPNAITARLSARDRLLDEMAYSKGRFAIETGGLPTVYIPAWPEVARVIEDCR